MAVGEPRQFTRSATVPSIFLAVTIPEESRVLAVSVGGDQSRPVDSDEARKESVVLVALPNTSEGDLSFPVRMILAGRKFSRGEVADRAAP
ncbi:MAG: hypothetical protein Ct9H300mP1_00690 [Planctomycetaceae bacterium]|nr:MAG: hypothetical protein Ct9H300mP1_00690 [Planctomycetaceae bacterium]